MRAAISGRFSEFNKLEKMRDRLRVQSYTTVTLDMALQRALVRRNLNGFKKILSAVQRGSGQEGKLTDFARTLTAYVFEDKDNGSGLPPYTRALADRLQTLIYPGSSHAQEIDDLTQLLRDGSFDEQARGSESVRKGVVKIGVARWKPVGLKPAGFVLQPPARMPRRELIYVPDPSTARGWIFSTAKR